MMQCIKQFDSGFELSSIQSEALVRRSVCKMSTNFVCIKQYKLIISSSTQLVRRFKMQRKIPISKLLEQNKEENQHTLKVGESSVRGKYQQQYKHYLNYDYTYTCYEFVKHISSEASKIPQLSSLPLQQTITAVSKLLFLNEMEFLFLSCLIKELHWPVFDETISSHVAKLKILLPESLNTKCLFLYLIVSAFTIKVYLNDNVKMFESELHDILPEFPQIFYEWKAKFVKGSLGINPKLLNNRFIYYTDKLRTPKQPEVDRDYDGLVDVLVESMPAPDSEAIKQEHSSQQFEMPSPSDPIISENRKDMDPSLKLIDDTPKVAAWPLRNDSLMSVISLPRQRPPNFDDWNNLNMSPRHH